MDLTALPHILQQFRIHQAPGVDYHIRLSQQLRAPHRDQIRSPAACAYKMYHKFSASFRHTYFFFVDKEKVSKRKTFYRKLALALWVDFSYPSAVLTV